MRVPLSHGLPKRPKRSNSILHRNPQDAIILVESIVADVNRHGWLSHKKHFGLGSPHRNNFARVRIQLDWRRRFALFQSKFSVCSVPWRFAKMVTKPTRKLEEHRIVLRGHAPDSRLILRHTLVKLSSINFNPEKGQSVKLFRRWRVQKSASNGVTKIWRPLFESRKFFQSPSMSAAFIRVNPRSLSTNRINSSELLF
eukprot:GABV01009612.1.p1 GENE.GABV01009612.1~~GABV01009612.1.p1  ORF type:complete len:198 (-),score=24.38 GABV01009612.1:7-600(-)